jgi:hypothetical protein
VDRVADVEEAEGRHLDAELRAGEVGEHGGELADAAGGGAEVGDAADVLVGAPVGEVDAGHVDPGAEHRVEDVGRVGRRPERGDDLRSAAHAAGSGRVECRDEEG